jgi:hypothetical protein
MTKRSAFILISAVLLAVSIIVSSILLILETPDFQKNPAPVLIASGLIVLSLFSVGFIYVAKIRKRPDEKKLNVSYTHEFETVKDAIMNSPLTGSDKKAIVDDVLELMLTAQANGKSAQAAIGDAASMAQGILKVFMSRPRSVVIGLINAVIDFLLFTLMACVVLWLEDVSAGFFNQRIDIVMLVFMAFISFILIPVIKRLTSRNRLWAYFLPIAAGIGLIGLVELLRATLYNSSIVRMLLDGSLVMIPDMTALLAILVIIMILFMTRLGIRRLPKRM